MKKKYKRLTIHVKRATVTEKEECVLTTPIVCFDKSDVEFICEQSTDIFKRNLPQEMVDKYLKENKVGIYTIVTANSNVNNVLLSNEELNYLCE